MKKKDELCIKCTIAIFDSHTLSSKRKGEKSVYEKVALFCWTTVAPILLAALKFAKPNSQLSPMQIRSMMLWASVANISKSALVRRYRSTRCLGGFSNLKQTLCLPNGRVKRRSDRYQRNDNFKVWGNGHHRPAWIPSGQKVATATVDDRKSHHCNLYGLSWRIANVSRGKLRFLCACRPPSRPKVKDTWFYSRSMKVISGGNIDYKGWIRSNPPTPEVFSKWGWTNSDNKLKLTIPWTSIKVTLPFIILILRTNWPLQMEESKADSVNIHTGTAGR